MQLNQRSILKLIAAMAVVLLLTIFGVTSHRNANAEEARANPKAAAVQKPDPNAVDLSQEQLSLIEVGEAAERPFPIEREAVGTVDFNEDMAAQVFPPYQGRIVRLFAKVGDKVIFSPSNKTSTGCFHDRLRILVAFHCCISIVV